MTFNPEKVAKECIDWIMGELEAITPTAAFAHTERVALRVARDTVRACSVQATTIIDAAHKEGCENRAKKLDGIPRHDNDCPYLLERDKLKAKVEGLRGVFQTIERNAVRLHDDLCVLEVCPGDIALAAKIIDAAREAVKEGGNNDE